MTYTQNHIDEQTLNRLALNDSTLNNEERLIIKQHLSTCDGCNSLFEQVKAFYSNVAQEIEYNTTLGERHKKELMKRSNESTIWTETISSIFPKINVSVPARIWYFARKRPIVSSFGIFAFVATLAFSLAQITKTFTDTNPSYFRIESKNLIVYNKSGDVVWEKPIDVERINPEILKFPRTKAVTIIDTDGDGINEVVTIFTFLDDRNISKNTITAYTNKGKIQWRRELGSVVRYGDHQYTLDFRIERMVYYKKGGINRFLVLILHTHSPSSIVSVDEKGNIVGEYWNYGHFTDITLADMDGDGNEELIAGLIDDESNQSIITAIDVEGIVGIRQSEFSRLADISVSGALKYYTAVNQKLPFRNDRFSFGRIDVIAMNKLKIEYGPSPGWLFTFVIEKELKVEDILATDDANEKYGSNVKIEINELKKATKYWRKQKAIF